ncbi:SOS response-associated peptidase [Cohnella zeiphila]|uniref:Abasic site processing protein n=1 Tax=Cohnella zeiphila TaxID=2761120 RepID=A0A7X0VWR5_9BACL|nr:SOS response-associated peptidase [Cohnella zeiphila]MBB6732682.1 SOS response-associated peptidase [Cohnella zeiphila]
MCGRYTITISLDELMTLYEIGESSVSPMLPRYNIAPTQLVPAIINDGQRNKLGELRWGLIPSWSKDGKGGFKMINARAETIGEKPAFKSLLSRKRCIIPADGFYEWKKSGSDKQPYRIVPRDGGLFSFAGLYDTWVNPDSGDRLSTCTIITTKPNELMEDIHDRMPVILTRDNTDVWLDKGNQDKDLLLSLLRPYEAEKMRAYKVDKAVGNVRNHSPELIAEAK